MRAEPMAKSGCPSLEIGCKLASYFPSRRRQRLRRTSQGFTKMAAPRGVYSGSSAVRANGGARLSILVRLVRVRYPNLANDLAHEKNWPWRFDPGQRVRGVDQSDPRQLGISGPAGDSDSIDRHKLRHEVQRDHPRRGGGLRLPCRSHDRRAKCFHSSPLDGAFKPRPKRYGLSAIRTRHREAIGIGRVGDGRNETVQTAQAFMQLIDAGFLSFKALMHFCRAQIERGFDVFYV